MAEGLKIRGACCKYLGTICPHPLVERGWTNRPKLRGGGRATPLPPGSTISAISTLWIVPKKPEFVNQSIENAEKHGQIKDSYYNSYKSPKLWGKRGKFIFVPKIDLWKFFFLSLSILESTELKQASCDPPPKKTSSIMCTAETWLCARKSVKARVSHNALSKCIFYWFFLLVSR